MSRITSLLAAAGLAVLMSTAAVTTAQAVGATGTVTDGIIWDSVRAAAPAGEDGIIWDSVQAAAPAGDNGIIWD
ncbi:hypothetical protein ABZ926_05460 [Streptomyces litmocidini]|uniref:hypothetical protein n=1 Tax=Streptomyces litmocidini TaxID=67318 RepID=UPI00340D9546